jgi:hypothetical protein
MAGGAPFRTTQTTAVEFPGAASFRFLKGADLYAPPPINPRATHLNHLADRVPKLSLACTHDHPFPHVPILPYSCFFVSRMLPWTGRKSMRRFPKFRDPRFALTTLQNPNIEVRTCAQLVQAAQQERERQARAAQCAAPQPLAAPAAPDSIPTTAFPENVASTAPAPLSTHHFLIGCAAIKNARNSPENNALHFSNRLKTAICSARFSRVLRSNNHESRVARHRSHFTTHQSLLSNRAFLIASERNIKNRRK